MKNDLIIKNMQSVTSIKYSIKLHNMLYSSESSTDPQYTWIKKHNTTDILIKKHNVTDIYTLKLKTELFSDPNWFKNIICLIGAWTESELNNMIPKYIIIDNKQYNFCCTHHGLAYICNYHNDSLLAPIQAINTRLVDAKAFLYISLLEYTHLHNFPVLKMSNDTISN